MPFVALDFETPSTRRSSAYAVGIVVFDRDSIRYEWFSWLAPSGVCDAAPQAITHLDQEGAHVVMPTPSVLRLAHTLWPILDGATIVSHTHYDETVVNAISKVAEIPPPGGVWIDSCTIARKVWSELPNHRLKTVCNHLNYRFWHHHPLEDARACAHIVRTAMRVTGWNSHALRDAFGRVRRRGGQYA